MEPKQIMQSLSWQEQLAQAIRETSLSYLEYAGLEADSIGYSQHGHGGNFLSGSPHAFANRITTERPKRPYLATGISVYIARGR